jgi:hypothetical protein
MASFRRALPFDALSGGKIATSCDEAAFRDRRGVRHLFLSLVGWLFMGGEIIAEIVRPRMNRL